MRRILVSVVSALAVGFAAFLVPTSTAQAAEFGSGNAQIRIDADRAPSCVSGSRALDARVEGRAVPVDQR